MSRVDYGTILGSVAASAGEDFVLLAHAWLKGKVMAEAGTESP